MYKLYKCVTDFGIYDVYPVKATYSNGRIAILLITSTGEELARLTVNIPNHDVYEEDNSFVDTNNVSWAEEFLLTNYLAVDLYLWAPSGFCKYPLYKFNLDKFYDYVEIKKYINTNPEESDEVSTTPSNLKLFSITLTNGEGTIVHYEEVLAKTRASAEKIARKHYMSTLEVSNV